MINITEKDLEKLKKLGKGQYGEIFQVDDKTAYKIYFDKIEIKKNEYIYNPALYKPVNRLKRLKNNGKNVKNTDFFLDYIFSYYGEFKGILIPFYGKLTLINALNYSFNEKINIVYQLIENDLELIDNRIYPKDLKLNNVMIVNGKAKIIDLDDVKTSTTRFFKDSFEEARAISALCDTIINFLGDKISDKKEKIKMLYDCLERNIPNTNMDLNGLNHYLNEKKRQYDYLLINNNTDLETVYSLIADHTYRILLQVDCEINNNNYEYLIDKILQYRKNNIALYDIVESNNLENYMTNINVGKCLVR